MAVFAHNAASENGFSFGTVGGMIDKDASAVSRAFDREDPSTVLRLLAALLLLDKDHTWIRGVCRLVGGEFIEKPRLTKEQKYDLVVEALRRHGKVGVAILDEALEGETP